MSTTSASLHVHDVIDSRPLGRLQFCVIALCMLTAVLDGFDTQTIGMLAPAMSRSLGIPITNFGPIFSAGLVGMLAGAVILGPLADRYGRKTMIVLSSVLFGGFSLATAYVHTFEHLMLVRLLTGFGLGGALPNAISLASEYAPKRHARTAVATLMCGMPLGAVLGGLISAALLPVHGWPSVFVFGGVLPLLVALAAGVFMPESARFLVGRGGKERQLARIMQQIAPDLNASQAYRVPVEIRSRIPIRDLFASGVALQTVLLWIPYFMNLVVLYFIVSWMPAVLVSAGHPVSVGITAISLFSIGGVAGCIAQGPLMNRFGMRRMLLCDLFGYAVFALVLANGSASLAVVVVISILMGITVQGAQAALNALAAESYPIHMRATGVGCAVGIGRVGSICGPLVGGVLLRLHWDVSHIFLAGILPAIVAAAAVAVNRKTCISTE